MAVATFDTLKYAKALKAAGFADSQVDAQVDALKDALQTNLKDLVTNDELKHAVELLKHEIRQSEQKLRSDISLVRWMVGSVGFGIVAILIRLFIFKTPF